MENILKPLVEFTFSFSWWILISNLIFDVLIFINENVSYTKIIQEKNYVTVENHQPVVLFKFAMYKMLFFKCRCALFMKCDEGQLSNDITVNTHCDVTMGSDIV